MTRNTSESDSQRSSLNKIARRAAFVNDPGKNANIFKDQSLLWKEKLRRTKIFVFTSWQKIVGTELGQLIANWRTIAKDATIWFLEAAIEGLITNFVLAVLFGARMDAWTIIAYGALIKQALSIVDRLRRNGTTTKISDDSRKD